MNMDYGNLSDYSVGTPMIDTIIKDFHTKALNEFNDRLKEYVIKNLKVLGIEFSDEREFIDFVSKRITSISDVRNPNEHELYLDYKMENQKLIVIYNDEVSFSYEGSKVTVTFGRTTD